MMRIFTWILSIGCLISSLALVVQGKKNDFEVFQSSNGDGSGVGVQRSQSLYPESDYRFESYFTNDKPKVRPKTIKDLKPVPVKPAFTDSIFHISRDDVTKRLTRSPQEDEKETTQDGGSFDDGYNEFLAKYFSQPDDDQPDTTTKQPTANRRNSQYRQAPTSKSRDVEHIGNGRRNTAVNDDSNDQNDNDAEYERIKLLSQKQEEEIKQNPKHCKVTVKGNMRCSVCKNPQSGAHSESCSFSSTAEPKKYAYTKERNYNSKDDEPEDDGEEEGDEEEEGDGEEETQKNERIISTTSTTTTTRRPIPIRQRIRSRIPAKPTSDSTLFEPPTRGPSLRRSQPIRSRVPKNNTNKFSATYKAEESRQYRQVVGLDPFLYGGGDEEKSNKSSPYTAEPDNKSFEDYFSHVFPDSKNGRFAQLKEAPKKDDVEYLPNYDTKKNVEKVLEEFKAKDWSKCDKKLKGDLTCYQCKDERGVRHEECIYVSHPQTSRLTYSEIKEFKDPNDRQVANDDEADEEDDAENHSSDVHTERSIIAPDLVNKRKLKRKLVVRKRKTKIPKASESTSTATSYSHSLPPKPEDVIDHHGDDSDGKQTIKRTISYRIESNNNEQLPAESQVMVYQHKFSHIS